MSETISAFLMPLIAIVTATIVVLQYLLAKMRWRLDLYDKRSCLFVNYGISFLYRTE